MNTGHLAWRASALPLSQPVAIDFTPRAPEVTFICGMDMLKGTIRVE